MTYFLLSPLLWGLLLAALIVWRWSRAGRWSRCGLVFAGAACWLCCTPLGANALVARAEARLPVSARCQAPAGAPIVVLAGGFTRAPRDADDVAALAPESWRRLRAATGLQRRLSGPLWIAGGGDYPVKESQVLAGLARDWHVAATSLHIETGSTTTRESALALRGVLAGRFTLVSSALHLPRAVQAFTDAGLSPCAVASGSDVIVPSGIGDVVPQATAITKSQAALHELAGALAYRLRDAD
jgi:uncharacterized SAM-binding protein YcdF (DUF218 family)